MSTSLKTLDIVVPVYNESGNIQALFSEVQNELIGRFGKIRLIIIDDGRNDFTSVVIVNCIEKFPELKILYIRFTRNYGKEIAVKCGIDHSDSDPGS